MATIGDLAYVLKCELAVATCRRGDDPLQLAHAVRHLGEACCHAGQPSRAEPCFVEALSIYRQHEQTRPLDLANALRAFAVLHDQTGAANEAQRLWQEAHDLYAAGGVTSGVAESAARLALIARQQGQADLSRELLGEALAAAEAARDPETLDYVREVSTRLAQDTR